MKILMTGATGFIGRNLKEHFELNGHEVKNIGRKDWSPLSQLTTEFYVKQMNKISPEIIIHCAGEIYNQEEMYKVNFEFIQWLLKCTKEVPYKCFINIGSSSEYGANDKPMKESDALHPRNPYECTKAMGTLYAETFARMNQKPIVTIRPFSVYGKHEPAHRLVPTIMRNLREGKPTTIAPGMHDWIYIKDFIRGVQSIIDKVIAGKIVTHDIFNMGTGICMNNEEVFNTIKNAMGLEGIMIKSDNYMRSFDTTISWKASMAKTCSVIEDMSDWIVDMDAAIADMLNDEKLLTTTEPHIE
ncbi:MAG TPA: hypothetical protein DCQ93_03985 [Bacteroidetes bacterium]|nr:hypothetical protein [Bacteroidota bacterium]